MNGKLKFKVSSLYIIVAIVIISSLPSWSANKEQLRKEPTSLNTFLKKLSVRLTQNLHGQRIFMSPVVEANYRYTSEFSSYVSSYMRNAITSSGQAVILEKKSVKSNRSLEVRAKKVSRLETGDAVLSGADVYFEGFYSQDNKYVHVSLILKDLHGKVFATADERIDRSLITTMNMQNPEAKILAEKADAANERQDRMIKISATKGDKFQVYYMNEEVKFHIMVAKPLYVHIYNIDPAGNVKLLYPNDHELAKLLQSKLLYTIPSVNDKWSIVVNSPPYGTELIKAFAFEHNIKLPSIDGTLASRSFIGKSRALVRREKIQEELSTRKSINQDDLVDYYRGTAKANGTTLYEDTIFIQTKEKDT